MSGMLIRTNKLQVHVACFLQTLMLFLMLSATTMDDRGNLTWFESVSPHDASPYFQTFNVNSSTVWIPWIELEFMMKQTYVWFRGGWVHNHENLQDPFSSASETFVNWHLHNSEGAPSSSWIAVCSWWFLERSWGLNHPSSPTCFLNDQAASLGSCCELYYHDCPCLWEALLILDVVSWRI